MRLSKRELAERLRVSERSLTAWQRQGLPVLQHGKRGQVSCYDLGAVLAWIRRTRDPRYIARVPLEQLERECGLAPAPVQTSGLTAAELDEMNREHLVLETALLQLPAIAARAGAGEEQIDALLAGIVGAIGAELGAAAAETWRAMLAEERARPGSWST